MSVCLSLSLSLPIPLNMQISLFGNFHASPVAWQTAPVNAVTTRSPRTAPLTSLCYGYHLPRPYSTFDYELWPLLAQGSSQEGLAQE